MSALRPRRPDVTLRPVEPDDRAVLVEVYASSRADELAQVAWTDEQRAAFIEFQFDAQDQAYRQYEEAEFMVVLADGVPAGRLYLARFPGELRIVDIALLPAFRGRGIGTSLVEDVMALAAAEGRRVSLHVERWNPARRLYERLGFVVADEEGPVYVRLERV